VIIVLPPVAFAVASLASRMASGGTFYAQAAANRRNSLLLLVTLVGVVAATAEIIAITLTRDPMPALWAAGIAVIVGLVAAAAADRFGAGVILDASGARTADPKRDRVLIDVVQEMAIAANIPIPATYVIDDASQNAFATGRDPKHASIAVTRGMLQRMDREQLQGVVAHELGHVRNLDTRYALYVAVLVGLVALVTDGFLRLVVEGWKQGAFFWSSDDDDSALAGLAMGVLVGTFLLIVAGLLRIFAPLFSALVQAATSREREYLADGPAGQRSPRRTPVDPPVAGGAHRPAPGASGPRSARPRGGGRRRDGDLSRATVRRVAARWPAGRCGSPGRRAGTSRAGSRPGRRGR
jgi:heat shock protein HtpX